VAAVREMELWRQLRSLPFAAFAVAVVLTLLRARDQPSVGVAVGSTTADVVPADLALLVLFVLSLVEVRRRGFARAARSVAAFTIVFCLVLLGTAAANGATAFVAGVKLCELTVLALAAMLVVRTRSRLDALADLLILFTIAADVFGVIRFIEGGGGRQPSFLGEHDYAAIATLPLCYGLVLLYSRGHDRRAWSAIVVGSVGCVLSAALASLLGLYVAVALLMVALAIGRRLTLRDAAVTVLVVGAVTAGTLTIRSGELGFLQSWFGKPPSAPGQYASSWSQRLIFAYIGGRIFIDHPLLGTGWWSDLPPQEFAKYLPDARRHYSDQPANYFPTTEFIPQQTYDEMLYELGIVGGALFLGLLVSVGRAALRAGRRGADAVVRLVPTAWFAASLGALAGEGFFGGTPLAASFWLVAGVAVGLAVDSGAR
jgi:hypothetical protein